MLPFIYHMILNLNIYHDMNDMWYVYNLYNCVYIHKALSPCALSQCLKKSTLEKLNTPGLVLALHLCLRRIHVESASTNHSEGRDSIQDPSHFSDHPSSFIRAWTLLIHPADVQRFAAFNKKFGRKKHQSLPTKKSFSTQLWTLQITPKVLKHTFLWS